MKIAIAILWLALSALAGAKPNIVLLMGDDHGWSETGYNGHPHLKTPVLDEMAASGLRLDRCYAAHPSCSPTRGSFLTGRHPNRYGTFSPGWSIRPEEKTIAHHLGGAGYRCGHFGKWHLGPVKAESPTNPGKMGFHEYVSHDNFYEMDPAFSVNGAPPKVFKGEGSEVTIQQTTEFIDRAQKKETPFLAVVWFGSPHEPYSGLPKDLALYDDLPEGYARKQVKLTSMKTGLRTQRPLRDVLRERYAEITAMDRAIGQLRDHLEETGLREDTLVLYCGDNGDPSSAARTGSVLRGQKGQFFEGGIRVPGVIEWPAKIDAPRRSTIPMVTSDLLPTLCELAGIDQPSDRPLDGISLVPFLENEMSKRDAPIYFWGYPKGRLTGTDPKPWIDPSLQQGTTPLAKKLAGKLTRDFLNYHQPPVTEADYGGTRAMVEDRYKLILQDEGKNSLYDLRDDPKEEHDLSAKLPDRVESMSKELRRWQESVLQSLRGEDYQTAPEK